MRAVPEVNIPHTAETQMYDAGFSEGRRVLIDELVQYFLVRSDRCGRDRDSLGQVVNAQIAREIDKHKSGMR